MARNQLSDRQVRAAKPKDRAFRLLDGDGLNLYVPPSGVAAWQLRFRFDGREQVATLGKLSLMTLAEARAAAEAARRLVAAGKHPTVEKRVSKARAVAATGETLDATISAWIAHEAPLAGWSADHREKVRSSLHNHLGPLLPVPLLDINPRLVAPHLDRARRRAPQLTLRVVPRLRAALDFAVERGLLPANPIPAPRRRKVEGKKHLPALLDPADIGLLLRTLAASEACAGLRRAHWLLALTAQRVGEIVAARWSEFDLDGATWMIPRARMKMKSRDHDHAVPLPPQLLAMLIEWKRDDGAGTFVCKAPRGDGFITREAVEKAYRRLGYAGRHGAHGWRTVLATWSRDAGEDGELAELQLDHLVGSKVAQAYDRSQRLDLRRGLMARHEARLLQARDGG